MPPLLLALLNAFQIPDLRRKLIFTGVMLVLFRFVAHVPVPGVNWDAVRTIFANNQLIGMLDLFSGGAMATFSIASMGVYPYITASIIMQLLVPIIPRLAELQKEGESGRNKINQITHWITVPLAALQGYGTITFLNNTSTTGAILPEFGFDRNPLETLAVLASMVAGTMVLIWFGELITQYGIGNGVSIIIFGGIVARLPSILAQGVVAGQNYTSLIFFGIIGLIIVAAIVFVYQGERRIPVQYARRVRGNRMYGGNTTHIPLKVNSAGMIPLIFASSIMIFPGTLASYFLGVNNEVVAGIARAVYDTFNVGSSIIYWVLYFLLVVGFTFFYAMVIFQQQNIAENLQKYGGFVPGIRPGRPTEVYLVKVLTRITWIGAIFLGLVAVTPFLARSVTNVQTLTLSSTALLIVVGVVLDTMKQLEAQLLMRQYQGFIK